MADRPSMQKAWEFFYKIALPRRVQTSEGGFDSWIRVEAHEEGGTLYPFPTPLREMGDFGIGMGLYFSSRVGVGIVLSILAVMNLYTAVYFMSDAYSNSEVSQLPWDLQMSAACDSRVQVCLDESCNDKAHRMGCENVSLGQGMVDALSVVLFFVYLYFVTVSQHQIALNTDLSEQTASDYSIIVEDPGPDDLDPEEWRIFFSRFGHVTYVTIGVANGHMLKLLAKRRSTLLQIHIQEQIQGLTTLRKQIITEDHSTDRGGNDDDEEVGQPAPPKGKMKAGGYSQVAADEELDVSRSRYGRRSRNLSRALTGDDLITSKRITTDLSDEEIAPSSKFMQLCQFFGFFRDLKYFQRELKGLDTKINELIAGPLPPARKIYVTFETEAAQRKCLVEMKSGRLAAMFNIGSTLSPDRLFRYENVLEISESPEPAEIRWAELDTPWTMWLISLFEGVALIVVMIFLTALLCHLVEGGGPWMPGLIVALSNYYIGPLLEMVNSRERHSTLNSSNISLLLKLVVARWCITVSYTFLEPFKETLDVYTFQIIRYIFIFDTFLGPVLNVLDLPGRWRKHVLAPLSNSQERMNTLFEGSSYSLAERYTDMSKSIFLCLYFSALFPLAYFYCAIAHFLNFVTDQYCLLRQWRQQEPEDDTITRLHRSHLAIAIFTHCVITLGLYAEWPFDNLCPSDDPLSDSGQRIIDFQGNTDGLAERERELGFPVVWYRCAQEHSSPFLHDFNEKSPYMTNDQSALVLSYKITAITAAILLVVAYFSQSIKNLYYDLVYGYVEPQGEATTVNFTEVDYIEAFIPQVEDPVFRKPLLACDISFLDPSHISWEGNHEAYNLNSEIDFPGLTEEDREEWFSLVHYYAPDDGEPEISYMHYLHENEPEVWEHVKHLFETDEPREDEDQEAQEGANAVEE